MRITDTHFYIVFKQSKEYLKMAEEKVKSIEIFGEDSTKEGILINSIINRLFHDAVNVRLARELLYLHQNGSANLSTLMRVFKVSRTTTQRDMANLKRLDLVTFEGAPKTGRYVLTQEEEYSYAGGFGRINTISDD